MPSHIYVQLGMWQQVAASNVVAYKAAVDVNTRLKLAEGREDFHTLSWLAYANLMLGKFDDAKGNVEHGEAGGRAQSEKPGRSERLPRYARALHPRDGAVGEDLARARGARRR